MTTNSQTELPNSVRPKVPLRREQTLTIKRHCDGALKQVVGYYENMAEKDPTGKRFVFAGPDAALAGINKKHTMSRRALFDALKTARALHIISEPLTRVRGGKRYDGVIVAHPAALCAREGAWSVFTGRTPTPPIGRWREEEGLVFWQGRGTPFGKTVHSDCTAAAPPLHSDCTDHCTATALETSNSRTQDCTIDCTAKAITASMESPKNDGLVGEARCTPLLALQTVLQTTLLPLDLRVSQSETLKTVETPKTLESACAQEQKPEGASSSLSGLTDQKQKPAPIKCETIGDHFALGATVELMTDGELDPSDTDWSKSDWQTLLGCLQEVVDAKASLPFSGRSTCAQLMGDGMKRLRERHGKDAPRPWVRVIKHLRETSGPAMVNSAAQQIADDRENEKAGMLRTFGVVPDGNGGWKKPE